jgi:hypothetical protein
VKLLITNKLPLNSSFELGRFTDIQKFNKGQVSVASEYVKNQNRRVNKTLRLSKKNVDEDGKADIVLLEIMMSGLTSKF